MTDYDKRMRKWRKRERKAAKRGLRLLANRLDDKTWPPSDPKVVEAILDVASYYGMSAEINVGGPESTNPEIVIFTNWSGLMPDGSFSGRAKDLSYIGDLTNLAWDEEDGEDA